MLLVAACHHEAAPSGPAARTARIVDVRLHDRSDGVPRDLAPLTERAAAALARSGPFAVERAAKGESGDYKLDVELRLEHGTDAGAADAHGREARRPRGVLRAFVGARLTRIGAPVGEAPIRAQAVAEREDKPEDAVDAAARTARERAHLEHALDDVLKVLAAEARLHVGDSPAIAAALADPDADVRSEAIRVAAERKERAAVPALCEILKGDDARLRDEALGALVEIGDRAAVPSLTRVARFKDLEQLPKVIDAVGALGGDEARAFLEFVASSHESAGMRQLAEEAIARLEKKQEPPEAD